MTLRRLSIFLLSVTVLSGLILFGYLLIVKEFSNPFHNTLIQQLQAVSMVWGYALVGIILFIGLLIVLPLQLPGWRFQFRFRRLDSAALDIDTALCQRFYREALAFRCRYGSKRFERQIIGHFDFFYDFHNDALLWMDTIVNDTVTGPVPEDFLVTSICSGHIGRTYNSAHYRAYLTIPTISPTDPVFLHAHLDRIEIWSATSPTPLLVLKRHPLTLEQNQTQPDNIFTRTLNGVEKATGRTLQLELRCLGNFSGATQPDTSTAQQQLHALQTWIEELALGVGQSKHTNFGIDVAEIHEGAEYEVTLTPRYEQTPLIELLQQLLGSHIDGFFTRATLPIHDPALAPDAVVLCSGLGVVAITDIPLAGSISYSGDPHWTQIDAGDAHGIDNACLFAQRSKSKLANLLSSQGLIQWPILNLVVFSHPDVSLRLLMGKQRVQCDVVTLQQLPNWFASKSLDATIRFNKDDYNRFIALLDPARVHNEQAIYA